MSELMQMAHFDDFSPFLTPSYSPKYAYAPVLETIAKLHSPAKALNKVKCGTK